jgi:hypothetical protein
MMAFSRAPHVWIVVLLALSLGVCGGSDSNNAAGPTTPIPVMPAPTPVPGPMPDPPLSTSCTMYSNGDPTAKCDDDNSAFLGDVQAAISILKDEHPEFFDGINVVNQGGFYVEIIKVLDRMSLCADFDGEELQVKNSDDFSEQYDIMSSKSEVRTSHRIYLGTCRPAVFPLPEAPLPPSPASCPLAPSRFVACGREPEGRFYGHVEESIDELLAERPELFDPDDFVAGQGHPALRDPAAYHEAMLEKLVGKGYCAIFDGEEIQLKSSNEFTEHYDVNFQDKYVRRGPGIYRGSCYPAAF